MNVKRVVKVSAAAGLLLLLLASCRPVQAPAPGAEAAPEATAAATEETVAAPAAAEAPRDTVISMPVAAAPTLDGIADEAFWAEALPQTVKVAHGANTEKNEVTLKSVYSGDMIYFLVTWPDPTESFVRSPWVKQEDGTWKKLTDPNDKGGDNNVYYEDKMAFIWSINDSIPGFESKSCATACHLDKEGLSSHMAISTPRRKAKWATSGIGSRCATWARSTTSISTRPSIRRIRPKPGATAIRRMAAAMWTTRPKTRRMPAFMGPEGYPRDGSPGYILDTEKVPFDDSLFAAGDMIPGIVKSPFTGDRGNISAGWKWADGAWTLELGRPLVTGSEFDVQFDDLTKSYPFGVAVFDNAQVRHAFQQRAEKLIFQQ